MRYASWSAAVICRFTWMTNVTPKRQRAGAVQDAFARFGSDRTKDTDADTDTETDPDPEERFVQCANTTSPAIHRRPLTELVTFRSQRGGRYRNRKEAFRDLVNAQTLTVLHCHRLCDCG
jgi:hypothetical protein